MKFIDLHCDTLSILALSDEEISLKSNDKTSVDFERLKKGNALAQFFAIYLPSEATYERLKKEPMDDDEYILKSVKILKEAIEENPDLIAMAYNAEDIKRNKAEGKMSAILTIEDGRSIEGKLEKIKQYYDLGVRLITLTWNHENSLGYPNSKDPEIMKKGLKAFGIEAIEYMNDLGIIVDVSHLSDGGFYDVARVSKRPFIASHSNARAISPHQRNLTDEMIKIISDKGGVVGLNFCPPFLNQDAKGQDSTIELMVKHLNHIRNVGGEDVIALGSDLDGIGGNLEIDSCDKIPLLFKALEKAGWSSRLIEKLAYENALRVIGDVMK
ncbi:MAG: membrane dipeptidase [Tissierellia bacterium]|nr:membrane dipeptidase [Tissierellia bacterium]